MEQETSLLSANYTVETWDLWREIRLPSGSSRFLSTIAARSTSAETLDKHQGCVVTKFD